MAFHSINMFKQLRLYIGKHRIKYEIYPFSPGKFGCRNEIRISRNQHNGVNKFLQGKRSNIHTYFHVNAFLTKFKINIIFRQVCKRLFPRQQFLSHSRINKPIGIVFQ